jgi:signal transduction histidine kinase
MRKRETAAYIAVLAGCLVFALAAGSTTLGTQFDNDVYDFLFRIAQPEPGPTGCVIAGIDEHTLQNGGGIRSLRAILANGLERIAQAKPAAVALDIILAEPVDAASDAALAAALAKIDKLVLATGLTRDGGWDDPIPMFTPRGAAIGHIHADPDPFDNIVRRVPLEKAAARKRRFAMALETLRVVRGLPSPLESPDAIEVGSLRIPARRETSRAVRVLYRPLSSLPEVSFHTLTSDPVALSKLAGKAVFVGITAQSASQDLHMTPSSFGQTMPGVEINANAYETLRAGTFLEDASPLTSVLFCLLLTALAGLLFWRIAGWKAYAAGGGLLAATHLVPYFAFQNLVVFPYAAPVFSVWLATGAAAGFQHFVVRRRLARSEQEKQRYQQAIHFVAHEMRSPLSAIQGSSEMMGRYKLTEEKRAEMALLINNESKRLARMIQTFLDVERLTEGQMELKREPFDAVSLADICIERVRPLAERKRITIQRTQVDDATITGDRELMEYALYNLLTNAVKYSGAGTQVTIGGRREAGMIHVSVRDEGIGMDEKELASIFQKFYRTQKAEASGEAGTGIGLSIVEQIVVHHGGKMEVTSQPGVGSCFTMVIPASAAVPGRTD